MQILLISLCGAAGVLARYGLTLWIPGGVVPWAILIANVVGSFLAGWIYASTAVETGGVSPWGSVILVGFLGGLTTFSSFSLDTARLLMGSEWIKFAMNIFLNNFLSIGACVFALKVAVRG